MECESAPRKIIPGALLGLSQPLELAQAEIVLHSLPLGVTTSLALLQQLFELLPLLIIQDSFNLVLAVLHDALRFGTTILLG